MSSHRTDGPSRGPRRSSSTASSTKASKAAKTVKPPRIGPAWYRKRRLATKRRVAAMSRKRRTWRRVGILSTWLLAGLAAVLVVAVVAFYQLSDVVTPDKIKTDQVATILYSDGSVMAKVGAENRTDVRIDQVPEQVKWAVLAAEDRNYYSNPGVSITGTLRAAVNDITGGETQGGSGITQQYVKNAYLNADQTLSRKLRELAIAVKLDRNYSKDTILEYYLNTIYFGRGAYGIQAAATTYFGVDVSKLDVAQSAVLASLIRSPGYYDPAVNPAAAKDRFQYVLDGMVETGHLTRAEADATAYPAVQALGDNGIGIPSTPVGLIVNRVLNELAADGVGQDTLNTAGLQVLTTIDPNAQQAAQTAIDTVYGTNNEKLASFQQNYKKALVAVQPSTGAVLAYWGGPNSQADQVDYAGNTCQAPGSSFKPYTLAVGLTNAMTATKPGYALNTLVDGTSPQDIQGVEINNDPSDAPYESRSMTVGRSIEVSLNTVFDAMAAAVGPDKVAAMAHAAGVQDTPCPDGSPSLQDADGSTGFDIGIGGYGVRTIDQAAGFATFADGGIARAPYLVTKVTANDGSVVYQHTDSGKQVMDPKVANDVTVGLGPIAQFSRTPLDDGRPSASKTGTYGIEFCKDGKKPEETTDANGNCADVGQNSRAWTVGFTPEVSVASFAGAANPTEAIYNSSRGLEYGRDLPGKAWQTFMDTYLAGTPIQKLPTKAEISGGQNTAPSQAPTERRTESSAPPTDRESTPAPTTSAPRTTAVPSTPSAPTTPVAPTTPSLPPIIPTPTRGGGGGGGGGG